MQKAHKPYLVAHALPLAVDGADERANVGRVLLVHVEHVVAERLLERAAQLLAQVRVVLHVDARVERDGRYDGAQRVVRARLALLLVELEVVLGVRAYRLEQVVVDRLQASKKNEIALL